MLENAMAITIDCARPFGDDELRELSRRNPGYQFERRHDGRLSVTPTSSKAGYRSGEVFRQLAEWNRPTEAGLAFDSSTGFRMPDGSVLSPDAAWIARKRWQVLSAEEQDSFAPLCPDAVFEVRSKSDAVEELRAKMQAYVANGALLGVLVDPYERFVEVWRSNGQTDRFVEQDRVAPGSPLAGFILETDRLYE